MKPQNLLIIMSDEHNPAVMGCAGHPEVQTPHLDQLAKAGTRFTNATCASPICVPARAAFATGRHIFETGYWDNVDAYDGRVPSWHHTLRARGHEVVAIGKLHFRGWEGDDYGFSDTRIPMHIHGGHGELKMLFRTVRLSDGSQLLNNAKAGWSTYNQYDQDIAQQATEWLKNKSRLEVSDKPWVLMVSLVAPHFPLTVPAEFFDLYGEQNLSLPKNYHFGINTHAHPYVAQYGNTAPYNLHFKTDADVRRALSGYYGLVSYMDKQVGCLLATLRQTGLDQNTRVVYTSDHGDNTGARGLWGKSTMYKESVGVPMVLRGEGIPAGVVRSEAVSHIDVYNTVLDAVGVPPEASTATPRSASLLQPLDADRMALSEYHALGSTHAIFMLQDAQTKYVHHCDPSVPHELYDLVTDPEEQHNLAANGNTDLQKTWERRLLDLLDPNETDQQAKARQNELIAHFGGRDAIMGRPGIGGFSPAPVG